jgi:GNAT superfamily N-acetyltransferase
MNRVSSIRIRPASIGDAGAIAELVGELGYDASLPELNERLERLLGRPDAGVLVAEVGGRPAAVASYQIIELLERSRPQCRITALVTGSGHRRQGVATALIEAIEAVARERGCFRLEVTSRPERVDALGFYTARGFHERPRRLVKPLSS